MVVGRSRHRYVMEQCCKWHIFWKQFSPFLVSTLALAAAGARAASPFAPFASPFATTRFTTSARMTQLPYLIDDIGDIQEGNRVNWRFRATSTMLPGVWLRV